MSLGASVAPPPMLPQEGSAAAAPSAPSARKKPRREPIGPKSPEQSQSLSTGAGWMQDAFARNAMVFSRCGLLASRGKMLVKTGIDSSVGVARQVAIEHPHHRLEKEAVAFAAMAVVRGRYLDPRDDFVRE